MRYAIAVLFLLLSVSGSLAANRRGRDRKADRQQVERTVAASPQVVVSACVAAGNITARGWDRNEVHARVSDGVQAELTRIDQTKSQPATELKLTALGGHRSGCLPFGDIEMDLPRNATLKLQTNNGDIRVTEVARVSASSQSGSAWLIKVRDEADVNTIGGEISVRDATGTFKLKTVGGSVDASNLGPAVPADIFEASTIGGDIRLERIKHQRLRVNTVSGELEYTGPLSRGGRYNFQSISGRLRLTLPSDSSFRLSGTLGDSGELLNEFGPKYSDKDKPRGPHGSMRRLDTVIGGGDASITVSFFSGSIQIRKR